MVSSGAARDMAADAKNAAGPESGLVFVGLIGLIDPARSLAIHLFLFGYFHFAYL